MPTTLLFRRRYTEAQWETLEKIRKEHGYMSMSDMIRKKVVKFVHENSVCHDCGGLEAVRFRKNLEIILPDTTMDKLKVMAGQMGLKPGEFIARAITDQMV